MLKGTVYKQIKYILVGFSVLILVFSGLTMSFGLQYQGYYGSSMEPTYEAGCHIAIEKQVDNISQIKEGDIISFEYGGNFPSRTHRVIKKYENYTITESNHFINERNQFVINSNKRHGLYIESQTPQVHTEAEQLENQTVLITKGDNLKTPDPILINEKWVESKPIYVHSVPDAIGELSPYINNCTS